MGLLYFHVTLVHCLICSLCVPVMNGSFNYHQGECTMHAKNIKIDCYIFMTFGAALVNNTTVLHTILQLELFTGPRGVLTLRVEGTL